MRKVKLAMIRVKRCSSVGLVVLSIFALSCSSTSSRTSAPVYEPLPEVRRPAPRVVAPPVPTPQADPVIRQIQGVLQERGYDPGPLDGVLGKKTREALRRFQKDHRLAVTGDIDTDTKTTLLSHDPPRAEAVDRGGTY